jgi:hypothetical protein
MPQAHSGSGKGKPGQALGLEREAGKKHGRLEDISSSSNNELLLLLRACD